jgi:hypothetical protein
VVGLPGQTRTDIPQLRRPRTDPVGGEILAP